MKQISKQSSTYFMTNIMTKKQLNQNAD